MPARIRESWAHLHAPEGPEGEDPSSPGLPWTPLLRVIWLTRPDLQQLPPLPGFTAHEHFVAWCMVNGRQDYRSLAVDAGRLPAWLVEETAPESHPAAEIPLTRLMRWVLLLRPDLQAVFDTTQPSGQDGFSWWYFIYGARELDLAPLFTTRQITWLNQPQPELPRDTPLPLTRMMVALWHREPALQEMADLRAPEGRWALLFWYLLTGAEDFRLTRLITPDQLDGLLQPDPRLRARFGAIVPLIAGELWHRDEALRARFGLDMAASVDAYRDWVLSDGIGHVATLRLALAHWQARHRKRLSQGEPPPPATAPPPAAGVTLIGYARGQLGIGEDVRMAALALRAAGIPRSVFNIDPGPGIGRDDPSLDGDISGRSEYRTSIICMTGMEHARIIAANGVELLEGRYTIGYWPWELPDWPQDWAVAFAFADEIWVSSRYTYEACALQAPVPVLHMPMAVSLPAAATGQRADFGLPEDRFLFLFAFDHRSYIARKNPMACLAAFRHAFPRGDEPAGLVVKAMNGGTGHPAWEALQAAAGEDPRITVIDQTLDRAGLVALFGCCDAFLSLHRAEGFGRGLAEAMLLGKPVIATGFSGNCDFTTEENACLVDYRLVDVGPDDYPCGRGQRWADPDPEHAAWHMRRLVTDPALVRRLADAGRAHIEAHHAPAIVGRRYAARLRALDLC